MSPFMLVFSIVVHGGRRRPVVSASMTVGCWFSSVTREPAGQLLSSVFSPRATLVGTRTVKRTAVSEVSYSTPPREAEG